MWRLLRWGIGSKLWGRLWYWFTSKLETQFEATPLTSEQEAGRRQDVRERAARDLATLEAAHTDEEVFYALPDAAAGAFHLERYERAESLARQTLDVAQSYKDSWHYGNAIHHAHTVLGLVAFHRGDKAAAIAELTLAGATPGSPQLDSFGPTMELAKALLHAGETDAALSYFQQCRSFWKSGRAKLDVWEQKVRAGAVPNFFLNAHL